ncbi:alpha/beta fold hydrolase [Plantactinospora siamensis]|uniref:Alpha/beta fold hydrolase n=1 Tax=Plantactinospora siamensis TaxID=555372 RepID=A0ABV6P2S3_9ACTN
MERITSSDGAPIVVHSTGQGPGIVLVHGGGVTIDAYRRLAATLADRFTVHLYNRRGRADAAPKREPYTVEQEVEDLAAVLEHTGADNVLGHSYGGMVVMETALRRPGRRIALYDGAVQVDGIFPTGYLDAAEAALRAGDTARSLCIVGAGVNDNSAAARLPLGVQLAMTRLLLRTPIGRTMGELLPTTLPESRQVAAHDGPADRYAGIEAEVLLVSGAAGPPAFAALNEALARALPRARTLLIPRCRHDAINRAFPRVVEPIAAFFAAPVTQQR